MKAALREKNLIEESVEGFVDKKTSGKALVIIIPALNDKLLKSIHDCERAKKAWDTLHQRYSGKTLVSNLRILNNPLTTKYEKNTDVWDHIAHLKSRSPP